MSATEVPKVLIRSKTSTIKELNFPDKLPGPDYKREIIWLRTIIIFLFHVAAVYGLFIPKRSWWTILFVNIYYSFGTLGITAGAHRLFTHKSYKANEKLKILLIALQTIAYQNSVFEWVRDHRVHHKFTDTNADPQSASRGFFFAHIGWLMCKKHPDIKKYGSRIDMSDLESDSAIMFQHKYYILLMLPLTFFIPILVPWLFWGEHFKASFFFCLARYIVSAHNILSINSFAHMWGMRPFDKQISPTDHNLTGVFCFGEGFHNYHHTFPWDYKASELGFYHLNPTTAFIDFFAWIGWATDLKSVSKEFIQKRIERTGDGSHRYMRDKELLNFADDRTGDPDESCGLRMGDNVWGWDDSDMIGDDKKFIMISNRTSEKR